MANVQRTVIIVVYVKLFAGSHGKVKVFPSVAKRRLLALCACQPSDPAPGILGAAWPGKGVSQRSEETLTCLARLHCEGRQELLLNRAVRLLVIAINRSRGGINYE